MDRATGVAGVKRRRPTGQASFESAPPLFDAEKKGKTLKNRIRGIERLLNKPVRARRTSYGGISADAVLSTRTADASIRDKISRSITFR